jgi:hypothetical protein
MAAKRKVTLAGSRHLAAADIGARARTREHRASLTREKRSIRAFFWSLAEGGGGGFCMSRA